MIKVEVYDTLIPLLEEMTQRSLGLASESLQVAGSKVVKHARLEMRKQSHHWFNYFLDGRYKIWKDPSATKQLGYRISHWGGGDENPKSMANILSFYLSKSGLTVTVGGAHPRFQPKQFKDGIHIGNYGKIQSAVGTHGRAIIHKLNTGEVTNEHPYKKFGSMIPNAKYVKGRHFMEKGFSAARGEIDKSLGERFERGFRVAVNRIDVKGIKRKFG